MRNGTNIAYLIVQTRLQLVNQGLTIFFRAIETHWLHAQLRISAKIMDVSFTNGVLFGGPTDAKDAATLLASSSTDAEIAVFNFASDARITGSEDRVISGRVIMAQQE